MDGVSAGEPDRGRAWCRAAKSLPLSNTGGPGCASESGISVACFGRMPACGLAFGRSVDPEPCPGFLFRPGSIPASCLGNVVSQALVGDRPPLPGPCPTTEPLRYLWLCRAASPLAVSTVAVVGFFEPGATVDAGSSPPGLIGRSAAPILRR